MKLEVETDVLKVIFYAIISNAMILVIKGCNFVYGLTRYRYDVNQKNEKS